MRAVAAALAVSLSVGCVNYTASQICVWAGASAVTVGGLVAIVNPDEGGWLSARDAALIGVVIPGLLFALSGVAGMAIHDSPEDKRRRADEEARRREEREQARVTNERAWAFTQGASDAARRGDCATVTKLDAQVRALDAEFHRVVFARDVAIARCLATLDAPGTTAE